MMQTEEQSIKFGYYIKLIGSVGALTSSYLLMAVGVLSILMAAYHAWALYLDPNTITVFADAFTLASSGGKAPDSAGLEEYRLLSWPVVIFLLLMQAKIGMWAIDAAVHLLDTIQRQRKGAE